MSSPRTEAAVADVVPNACHYARTQGWWSISPLPERRVSIGHRNQMRDRAIHLEPDRNASSLTTGREATQRARPRCGVPESARSPDAQKTAPWRPLASKAPPAKSFFLRQNACK